MASDDNDLRTLAVDGRIEVDDDGQKRIIIKTAGLKAKAARMREWMARVTAMPTRADINHCIELWPKDWEDKYPFTAGQVATLLDEVEQLHDFVGWVAVEIPDRDTSVAQHQRARELLGMTDADD